MFGQVIYMGGRVVFEAITPSHVQNDFRAAQLVVDIFRTRKYIDICDPRPGIDTLGTEIDNGDLVPPL